MLKEGCRPWFDRLTTRGNLLIKLDLILRSAEG